MKFTLKYIVSFFIVFSSFYNYAQKSIQDLKNQLSHCENDSDRVEKLILLADELNNQGENKQSLSFAVEALKLAKKIKNKALVCRAFTQIGIAYLEIGDYELALENDLKALKIGEAIGDKKEVAYLYHNIANIYREQGNSIKALDHFRKSLKLSEAINDLRGISKSCFGLGITYRLQQNYDRALEFYFRSLKIDEKLKDTVGMGHTYTSVAIVYSIKGQFEKALTYYAKALAIAQMRNDRKEIALCKINLGCAYSDLSLFDLAESNFKEALKLFEQIQHKNGVKEDYFSLANMYEKKGDTKNALKYYKLYGELKDELLSESTSKQIVELNAKYESEKKVIENKTLTQKNKIQALTITKNRFLIAGLFVLVILIVGLGILIIRQNKMKSLQTTMLFEQKLLRTQMNPHFIFNSLTSIESFIYEHEPKIAGIYLSKFARLMRLILENSDAEFITLERELEILNYYLSLQKLRLDDQLDYFIHIDREIIPEELLLPPMLLQPFIENAVEHGFRGSKNKGVINIRFDLMADNLCVRIEDNGIGIIQSELVKNDSKEHKSLALKITQERLRLLNKTKRKKLVFSISDRTGADENVTGTLVQFIIPL